MRNRASLLHQSAYLLCGDWHLANDLAQDTLVKAYQHWPRVRQADSPDAYVRRILLNEVRGRWRSRGIGGQLHRLGPRQCTQRAPVVDRPPQGSGDARLYPPPAGTTEVLARRPSRVTPVRGLPCHPGHNRPNPENTG
jgi:DNA-directed RNA polymerase specialized sigma24 family protein